MNLIIFVNIISLMLGANTGIGEQDAGSGSIDLTQVVESIQQAQLSGADVSGLVDKLNIALDLTRQAETSKFESCGSYPDCTQKANQILVMINHEAYSLRHDAGSASNNHTPTDFMIYAPLGAFMASLIGVYSFRLWQSHVTKRFLDMEIREKED